MVAERTRTEMRGHLPEVQRIERLEEDADAMQEAIENFGASVDRLTWTAVLAAFTLASTSITILITSIGG